MKKIILYFFVAFFGLAAISCGRDIEQIPEEEITITDSVIYAEILKESGTKTTLSSSGKVLWEEGDAIGLYFDGATDPIRFSIASGAGTTSASFTGSGRGDKCIGVYPMSIARGQSSASSVNVEFPAVQSYSEGTFGQGCNPMFAVGNENLSFRNAFSLIKLSLKGHHYLHSIVFESNSPSVKVSGKAEVSFSSSGIPQVSMAADASSEVTLEVNGVLLNDSSATDFYIAVPAQTYTGGFKISIITTSGSMTKTLASNFTTERSAIHSVSPFSIKIEDGVEPSTYLSGKGTENDPFLINSLADLMLVQKVYNSTASTIKASSGEDVPVKQAYFLQTVDIDLSQACSEASGVEWSPIGNIQENSDQYFSGRYDGGGHSVSNLYINNDRSYQGFFGSMVKESGTVSSDDGVVRNLTVSGSVKAGKNVGLIAGESSFIYNCISCGSVEGSGDNVGGITGNGYDCTSSINYASVKGSNYVGGIAGGISHLTSNCVNYGSVTASLYIGGIVGAQGGEMIYNCANFGDVSGENTIGGIIGFMGAGVELGNSINSGKVNAADGIVGGIFGGSSSNGWQGAVVKFSVINCVNIGSVSAPELVGFAEYTGGLFGDLDSDVTNSFWLYDPAAGLGLQEGAGHKEDRIYEAIPLTLAQMQGEPYSLSLYADANGNRYNSIVKALNACAYDNNKSENREFCGWRYSSSDSYPELTWETPQLPDPDGTGGFLELTHGSVTVPGRGGEFQVSVKSNMSYSITRPSWIKEVSKVQTSDLVTLYTFSVEVNPDYSPRTGQIVFLDSRGISTEFSVTQEEHPDYYVSTDYSHDGEVTLLQAASEGAGINIVLLGDAFSDRQIADGTYAAVMQKIVNAFFSEEPYATYKSLFTVYSVNVVSATEGYDNGTTALGGSFGVGSLVGGIGDICVSYAKKAVSKSMLEETLIIVAMNREVYAGTCYMYGTFSGDHSSGMSLAFCPLGTDDEMFSQIVSHEAGGHGFAKLADEYISEYAGEIPKSEIDRVKELEPNGWYKNVDFTDDTSRVKWSIFLSDSRYQYDGLGCFEGAYGYATGVWRPTLNSIMRFNTGGFNAPSREAIWYRIHRVAYGNSWQYNHEDFVTYDAKNRKTSSSTASQPFRSPEKFVPLHPPVVIPHGWEE